MIKKITLGLLSCYFFIFLVDNLSLAYDRYTVQFLILSVVNVIAFLFLLKTFSFNDTINSFKKRKPLLFYSVFIGFSALSIIAADNQVESVIVFSQYLSFFFALLLIYTLSEQSKINFVSLVFNLSIISIFLESTYILYLFFDNIIINGEAFIRSNIYRGFTANINISSFSLVAKSPVLIYYIYNSERILNKSLFGILIFMLVSCLWITLSRGAFIAFTFSTVIIMIYLLVKKINNYITSSSILIIPTLISYLIFSNLIVKGEDNLINERVASIKIDRQDDSIDERLRFWDAAIESIKENPIMGIGVGNWKIKSMKYDARYATGYRVPFHAHNDLLQVASESGVFASIFFALFLTYPFYLFIKHKIFNTKDFKFLVVLSMMMVYLIDTSLNFPIARPVSHILLIFISVTLIFLGKKYEKKGN